MTPNAAVLLEYLLKNTGPLDRQWARADLLLTWDELRDALQELRERGLVVVDWRAGGSWRIKESEVRK